MSQSPFAGMPTAASPSFNFLRQCFTCKRELRENKDLYIYMGEYSFCSQECRTFFVQRLTGEFVHVEPPRDTSLRRPETPKKTKEASKMKEVAVDVDQHGN